MRHLRRSTDLALGVCQLDTRCEDLCHLNTRCVRLTLSRRTWACCQQHGAKLSGPRCTPPPSWPLNPRSRPLMLTAGQLRWFKKRARISGCAQPAEHVSPTRRHGLSARSRGPLYQRLRSVRRSSRNAPVFLGVDSQRSCAGSKNAPVFWMLAAGFVCVGATLEVRGPGSPQREPLVVDSMTAMPVQVPKTRPYVWMCTACGAAGVTARGSMKRARISCCQQQAEPAQETPPRRVLSRRGAPASAPYFRRSARNRSVRCRCTTTSSSSLSR